MVGFLLRAVYGTLVTPALAVKWDEAEDGMCRLCATEVGTVQHILSGCKLFFHQYSFFAGLCRHNSTT